jgi:hypothetical protein
MTRRRMRRGKEGSDPEKDPPTSPEVVIVAHLSSAMEVAERREGGREGGRSASLGSLRRRPSSLRGMDVVGSRRHGGKG